MYSHHGPPHYLELFFTQIEQVKPERTENGWLFPWVTSGEDQATCLEEPKRNPNNILHFSVSETQPEGKIVVKSNGWGLLPIDCSCGSPVNSFLYGPEYSQEAKVDCHQQWVKNYQLEIKTPIGTGSHSCYQFPNREVKWSYPHLLGLNNRPFFSQNSNSSTQTLDVGRSDMNVDTSGFGDDFREFVPGGVSISTYYGELYPGRPQGRPNILLNHCWYDNRDRREPRTSPASSATFHWTTLTVDNGQLHVNSQIEGPETVDRSIRIFKAEAPIDPWMYDSPWHCGTLTNVNVERVPSTSYTITYYDKQNKVLSSTLVPAVGRGWLPASSFDQMELCSLEDTAIGLLALLSRGRLGMCEQVVQELIHHWCQVYGNDPPHAKEWFLNRQVLPETLLRLNEQVKPGVRRTRTLAWLGIALLRVAQALDPVPNNLDALLHQIATFIAYCTDTGNGWVYEGYDENDFLIGEASLTNTTLAAIFLNLYLQTRYDLFLHNRLSRMELLLDKNWTERLRLETSSTSYRESCYYLAYLSFHRELPDYERRARILVDHLIRQTLEGEIDKQSVYLFCHLLQHYDYIDEQEKSLWSARYYSRELVPGLYESVWESEPKLTVNAWVALDQFCIFPEGRFYSYFREMDAFRTHCYHIARYSWPYGERWTDEAKEKKQGTAIGSLLFALCDPYYGWFGLFSILKDSINLTKSQGFALDLWAIMTNQNRKGFEPDNHLRRRIQEALKPKPSTAERLAQEIQTNWPQTIWWEHNLPPKFWLPDDDGSLREVTWDESPELIDKFPADDSGRKFLYTENNQHSLRYLDQLLAQVTIETGAQDPQAVEKFTQLVPAGVKLNLVCLIGKEERHPVDSCFHTQSATQERPIAYQDVSIEGIPTLTPNIWRDEDDIEFSSESFQDLNTYRLVFVKAGTQAWLETDQEVYHAHKDCILVVPPNIPIKYGTGNESGYVVIPSTAFYVNYYGELPVYLYKYQEDGLQILPSTSWVVAVDALIASILNHRIIIAPANSYVILETGTQLQTPVPHILIVPPGISIQLHGETPEGLTVFIDHNCYVQDIEMFIPVEVYGLEDQVLYVNPLLSCYIKPPAS